MSPLIMNLPVSCSSDGLFPRILLWSELSHTLSCNKISFKKKLPVWISFYNIDIFIMLFLQTLFLQNVNTSKFTTGYLAISIEDQEEKFTKNVYLTFISMLCVFYNKLVFLETPFIINEYERKVFRAAYSAFFSI